MKINPAIKGVEPCGDADLICRISNRDEAALALLFDRYRTIVFGLLMRILNNRSEAEDILQDVFVHVWQQAANFDEEDGKVFVWLITITRQHAINRLRFLKTQTNTKQETSENKSLDNDSKISQNPLFQGRQIQIQTALRQLPDNQSSLLLMAYFEGCSQQEIAKRTKISLETIKFQMQMGLAKLSETLKAAPNDW